MSDRPFARLMAGARPLRTYRAKDGTPSFRAVPALHAVERRPRLETPPHTVPSDGRGPFGAVLDQPPFVGRLQSSWLRPQSSGDDWCELCRTHTTQGRNYHLSFDRDHIALNFFFHLCIHFPRTWHPVAAIHAAWAAFPRTATHLLRGGATPDDASRRAVLRALIMHLAEAPHCVVSRSIRGEAAGALTGHGEKIFRATMGEVVGVMLPPMGPNVAAAFMQKAWGRTNLMRLFDALGLGPLMAASYGATVRDDRTDKSAVLRQMICELHMAPLQSEPQLDNFFPGASTEHRRSVAADLAGVLLRLLALECVLLKSRDYMGRVEHAAMAMEYPNPPLLREMEFH